MSKKSRKYMLLACAAAFMLFLSCNVEEDVINQPDAQHFVGKSKVRMLRGNEVFKVKNQLQRAIEKSGRIQLTGAAGTSLRTGDTGTIDYSEIMEVIDSIGITNYTFKISNHPEDSPTIFHNLVLSQKNDGAQEILLLKYAKNNNSNSIQQFTGTVTAQNLSSTIDCPEITLPANFGNGSDNGGGGTDIPIPIPTPGNSNPPYGGSSNAGGGGSSVSDIFEILFACNSCSFSSSSWAGFSQHTDANGIIYPFTIIITFHRSVPNNVITPVINDPCPPQGDIGVLPDENILDCLTGAKLAEVFPNASLANRNKLADLIRQYGPQFGLDTKDEVCHFLGQVGGETEGLNSLNALEDLDYLTSERLVVAFGTKFSLSPHPTKIHPAPYIHNPEGLANFVYCCKYGNGDVASGDGWKYRGRGTIQVTWQANYESYENYINNNFPDIPYNGPNDLLNPDGVHAVLSGLWFFKTRVLDKIDVNANTSADIVTAKVNKFTDQLSKTRRKNFTNSAKLKLNCN